MNLLITSAGRRVSLVNYFQSELRAVFGEDANVFTTDLVPRLSTACLASDQAFAVGRYDDTDYMEVLLQLCQRHAVSMVVPTVDTELRLLAEHRDVFLQHGIQIVVSDPEFIEICRDKRATNRFFVEHGIAVPAEISRQSPTFPLFIKPLDGSNSRGLHHIKSADELCPALMNDDQSLWMKLVPTPEFTEYTVDCYYTKNGFLRCVVPRVRLEVRGGESNKGVTDKHEALMHAISESFNTISGARGCLTMQFFFNRSNHELHGIEINPRFGGGYPLSYLAGANYPRWLLQEYLQGVEVEPFDTWEHNLTLLRHDNEMLVRGFEHGLDN